MRVVTYKTLLDDYHLATVVKEREQNYTALDKIESSKDVADLLREVFQHHLQTEEVVYLLCMDTAYHLIGVFEISRGSVSQSFSSPREIYMKALLCNASSVIVAHNHPSGDPEPSGTDRKTCKQLKKAGKMIGVPLVDFLIIGGSEYYSFNAMSEL